jgi:hypothetical protein
VSLSGDGACLINKIKIKNTYIHTDTHRHTHTYTHTGTHTHTYIHTDTHTYTHTHLQTHTRRTKIRVAVVCNPLSDLKQATVLYVYEVNGSKTSPEIPCTHVCNICMSVSELVGHLVGDFRIPPRFG